MRRCDDTVVRRIVQVLRRPPCQCVVCVWPAASPSVADESPRYCTVVVGYFNASSLAKEHESHLEHLKEENGGDLPERVVYPYMTKRDKEFPWGNYTLFYNSHVRLLPLPRRVFARAETSSRAGTGQP